MSRYACWLEPAILNEWCELMKGYDEKQGVRRSLGTYLKALAARDNDVPFYVALPGPTIDWTLTDGVREIPIEERDPTEVTRISGLSCDGELVAVDLVTDRDSKRGATDLAMKVVNELRERGILAVKSGEKVLRLLPPLVVKRREMKRLLDALGEVLAGGAGV